MGEALKARGEARASTDRADLLTNTRLRARARSACFVGGGSFFEIMDGAACCLDGCQSSMSIRITPFPNCPPPSISSMMWVCLRAGAPLWLPGYRTRT